MQFTTICWSKYVLPLVDGPYIYVNDPRGKPPPLFALPNLDYNNMSSSARLPVEIDAKGLKLYYVAVTS